MNMERKFHQDLTKFCLPKNFRVKNAVFVQIWWLIQDTFFALSPQFMYGWRRFLLRLFGAHVGRNVLIRPSVKTVYPWNLTIGDNSWVGDDASLYTLGKIAIGSDSVVSQKCYLCTGSHDFSKRSFDILREDIRIGDGVWLAADVFVGPGVSVGDGAVVGARSTVLQDLPAGMICYGYPAKPVKKRVVED